MKQIAIVILVLLSLSCLAQTKEDFLNSVYKAKVDSSFTKYYLYSNCHPILLNKYDSINVVKDLSAFAPIKIISELIAKSKIDNGSLAWDCEKLEKANCIKSTSDILPDGYFITSNPKWNASKKRKEEEKQIAKQKGAFKQRSKQEKIIYSFSRPIFDEKIEYALIEMWSYCGNTCAQGCIVLFMRKANHWQKVANTSCKFT
jgi:hypothetical protein